MTTLITGLEPDVMLALRTECRAARAAQRLDLMDIAEELGYSDRYLGQVLYGTNRSPDLPALVALARYLAVPIPGVPDDAVVAERRGGMRMDRSFYSAIGRKGGRAIAKRGYPHFRALGQKGGATTRQRGSEYYSRISRLRWAS